MKRKKPEIPKVIIEEDGVYYVIVVHNLQSTGLIVMGYETDTGCSIQEAYKVIFLYLS